MELRVGERFVLLNLVKPVEGDVTKLRLVRSMIGKLGFNDSELEALKFEQKGDTVQWEKEADVPTEIALTPKEQATIKVELQKVNAQGKLTIQLLELYEKFCPAEEE